MKLDFITQKNSSIANKAIVFIHGWSGNRNSFLPFIKNIKINDVEWFLPEAPYLVKDAPPLSNEDVFDNNESKKSWTYKKKDGQWEIKEPIKMFETFLDDEVFKKYKSRNVYFIGFSQGAAVCYEHIMSIKKPLGGIFPIGGFLFKDSEKIKRVSDVNQNTPIIIGHGIKDDIIPIEKSKTAYNQLLEEGANVKFHKYSGGHKISMNYFREILKVING